MKLATAYRFIFSVVILLVSGFMSSAQDNVVVNSKHKLSVPNYIPGHTYKWKIFDSDNKQLKFSKDGDVFVIDETGTYSEIDDITKGIFVRWSVGADKTYTVNFTEFNAAGCNNSSEKLVSIIETPLKVLFREEAKYKVNDINAINLFTSLDFSSAGGIDLAKSYPFKVILKYKYNNGEVKTLTKLIGEGDNNLVVDYASDLEGFEETLDKDHYYEFWIEAVTDFFGSEVKIIGTNKFVWGAYKKPQ